MGLRTGFQTRRLSLLSSVIDLGDSTGLEIGACDLPTVPKDLGKCRYADFRSSQEMIEMWGLQPETVCNVDYILSRDQALSTQIAEKFDYVIACHVLEHVPDVISYLSDLKLLLKPGGKRIIFLTIPDKRATLDATRSSTTVERLLHNHHEGIRSPSFEHILEFHRHWIGYSNGDKPLPLKEAYDYASEAVRSRSADAHCNVWTGEEFREQIEELIAAGFLPGQSLVRYEPFYVGTNEFAVVLATH